MNQKPDYKNWVPKGMIAGMGAGTAVLAAGAAVLGVLGSGTVSRGASVVLGLGALAGGLGTLWSVNAHNAFSYEGKRQISRKIVGGTAEYVILPKGGRGLDVGCGSGALTIACAKRNPQGTMLGVDRWGRSTLHSVGNCVNGTPLRRAWKTCRSKKATRCVWTSLTRRSTP